MSTADAGQAPVGLESPNEQPEAEEHRCPNAEAGHEHQKQGAFDAVMFLVPVVLTQTLWLGLLLYFAYRLSI